jgi:nucleoside-diphosphate-sugar epimerase
LVNLDRKRAQEVIDTNLRGVETVVGGAHRAGIDRIVYVSSTAALFDPSRGAIHPQSPVAPSATSAYGLSKAQGELYVRGLQAAGACVKTTYPAGVIGPDDPDLSEGNQGLKFLLEGWPRIATSGGLQSIDVRDLANIHVALLEGEPSPGRYVAAGRYLEWHEVLDLLEEVTDQHVARMSVGGGWVRFSGWLADWLKQYVDIDVPLSQEGMTYATLWPGADDSKTLSELGFGYRPAAETYRATVRWLFDAGHIDAATAGVLGQEGL